MSGYVLSYYIILAEVAFGHLPMVATLFLAVLLLYILSIAYKNNLRIPVVAWLIDISERRDVIKHSPAKGAIMFLIGVLMAAVLFDTATAAIAVAVLALGDSFSTLIGCRYGTTKIPYNPHKSLQGSIAGFLAAFIGASVISSPTMAFIGALAGMLGESLPLKIDDNLVIPLFSGSAVTIFQLI